MCVGATRWYIISWYVCVRECDYREFKKKTLQSMSESCYNICN